MFDFDVQRLILVAVPFLLGITCHEVAHGYVSYLFGDPTAKNAGRLTLNPLKHLDPLGTLALVLTRMIGWAKPVPIDPSYYHNPRQGILWVSLAGPLANFAVAAIFYVFFKVGSHFFYSVADQTRAFWVEPFMLICMFGTQINIVLGIFNLIPIPPLDGSKVLACLLPGKYAEKFMSVERYGFVIVILLAVTGVLWKVISFVANPVLNLLFS